LKKKDFSRRSFIKVTAASSFTLLLPGCSLNKLNAVTNSSKTRNISSDSNSFDYIVVGSGAGGGPVCARLVEAGFRVLLIEAGGDEDSEIISVPAFHGLATEDDRYSWEFFVQHYENRAKQYLNSKYDQTKKGVFYPRATGLGGCTIHNAMITMYPDNSDWQNIVDITGDNSWNPKNMRKYFQKLEQNNYYSRPSKSRTKKELFNREKMGFDGWLSTEQTSPLMLLKDKKFLKMFFSALQEEGLVNEISEILGDSRNAKFDPNTWSYVQNKLDGVFNIPKATKNGKRSSTRDLILDIKRRFPNKLTVKTHSLVSKIDIDDNNRAIGVEVLEGRNLYKASPNFSGKIDNKVYYQANKEIILSGGAYNSPQVLMLSGIGDKNQLREVGIETKVELPGVGKNLQDRYEVTVVTEMPSEFDLLNGCSFGDKGDQCLTKYDKNPTKEVYGTNGVIAGIIKKSSLAKFDPDLFIFGLPGYFKGYYKGWSTDSLKPNFFTWAILKGHTSNSAGEVKLRSNSPLETPYINFKYFNESNYDYEDDLNAVLEGVKTARRINKRMSSMSKEEVFPGKSITSDNDIKNWIENEAWGHHASCSNKMGTIDDPLSVIDSKFRVHGVKGLRVVDASSFNRIPGLFIVCPIYMIAEKAAEEIILDSSNF